MHSWTIPQFLIWNSSSLELVFNIRFLLGIIMHHMSIFNCRCVFAKLLFWWVVANVRKIFEIPAFAGYCNQTPILDVVVAATLGLAWNLMTGLQLEYLDILDFIPALYDRREGSIWPMFWEEFCAVCLPYTCICLQNKCLCIDILDRKKGLFAITFCGGKCMLLR